VAKFVANIAVDFSKDLDKFLTTFADQTNYSNVGSAGFDATEPVIFFPRTVHVGGTFFTFGNNVLLGTVSSMAMHHPLGGDYTFTGLAIDYLTLETDVINHGSAFALADMLKGNDVVSGSGAADVLYGFAGADKMNGGGGNDIVRGGAGKDTLDGGVGVDLVDYSDKTSLVSVILNGSHFVTVKVGGVAEDAIRNFEGVVGGSRADRITGDAHANRLSGGIGNDTLDGKLGKDALAGGNGHDKFVFDTALGPANIDRIADFTHLIDKVVLAHGIFGTLGGPGMLAAAMFHVGAAAHDASDHIIYNPLNGGLFYDADGTGAAAAHRFATLTAGLALSHADFLVA
jgi:Ca2+-binding RTX toxin-like protein